MRYRRSDVDAWVDQQAAPTALSSRDRSAGRSRVTLDWASFRDAHPRTVSEVRAEVADRPAWLLDGLVHPHATLLTGPPKAGKSFLVVEWAEALASGAPWHGREVLGGPKPVLILPTDPGGEAEYARRFSADTGANIALMHPPRPGDVHAWQRLAEDAAFNGVGLVVLDNLYSYNPTAKITDNGEVGVTLAGLMELGRRGIAYLVVHHPPKGVTGYAGTTSIEAHFRHLLYMGKGGRLDIGGNEAASGALRLTRGNDGRTVQVSAVEQVDRADSPRPGGTARDRQAARQQRVEQAIEELAKMPPGMSDRAQARRLAAVIDGIHSESQGRTLRDKAVKAMTERTVAGPGHGAPAFVPSAAGG